MRFTSRHRELDADGGHDDVDGEQHHEGEHHGFVDRVADAGRAAADRNALVAGDQAGRQPEQRRLDQRDDDVDQSVSMVRPVANAPGETCLRNTRRRRRR